jgi:HD-GYP domain-containing protein (c-di-GMP phosphodiesterase class II)
MDGLGYPHGLRATEVPVGARIIAVADAYDAMTRPRVFRDAISHDEALLELSRCAGAQFDARVIETFKKLLTL